MRCKMHFRTAIIACVIIACDAAIHAQQVTLTNLDHPWLDDNCFLSVNVYLSGFQNGQSVQGIIATAQTPWTISLSGGQQFYNAPTTLDDNGDILFDGEGVFAGNNLVAGAPHGAFDTGLLPSTGISPFGMPVDGNPRTDAFSFCRFDDGAGTSDTGVFWLSLAGTGIPVNATTQLPIMRLTWPANGYLSVSFLVLMNTPQGEQVVQLYFPGPAAFGRCCLNGKCYLDYHAGCAQAGGTYIGTCQPCSLCNSNCPIDIAPPGGDGVIGVNDLLTVINNWGGCPGQCSADINADGDVNVEDLLAVINAWGPCPK